MTRRKESRPSSASATRLSLGWACGSMTCRMVDATFTSPSHRSDDSASASGAAGDSRIGGAREECALTPQRPAARDPTNCAVCHAVTESGSTQSLRLLVAEPALLVVVEAPGPAGRIPERVEDWA